VLLTSGAALWTSGRATTMTEGIDRATEALDDGRASGLLEDLRRIAQRFPGEAS
jgi:anthranilate phosphoribosyltransferase